MSRIIRHFPDTHMGLNQRGLKALAKSEGVTDMNLKMGEFFIFTNKAQNAFKLITANNVLVYFRHPENRRIDLNMVSIIPRFFNGKEFNYQGAMRATIMRALEKKSNLREAA